MKQLPELELKTNQNEHPVKIDGDHYVLIELTGKMRDVYLNTVGKRVRINSEGKPAGIKNFDGMQAGLVSQMLFKLDGCDADGQGGERVAVTIETIQGWASKMQGDLHDACQILSGLGDEDEEDAEGKD